eukprot:55579_1
MDGTSSRLVKAPIKWRVCLVLLSIFSLIGLLWITLNHNMTVEYGFYTLQNNETFLLDYDGTFDCLSLSKTLLSNLSLVPLQRQNTLKILYIKTHKTASSTITNLFHSYCVKYNKSCILYCEKGISGRKSLPKLIRNDRRSKFKYLFDTKNNFDIHDIDIFLDHCDQSTIFHQFNIKTGRQYINYNQQIVTILRNPNRRVVSRWYYNKYVKHKRIGGRMSLQEYIDRGYNRFVSKKYHNNSCSNLLKNAFNMDVNNYCAQFNTAKYFDIIVNNIMNGNWLILITEHWDESMILLKYAYNLNNDDIVYQKMKVSKKYSYNLTEMYEYKLRQMLNCDWFLYHLSLHIFHKRIKQLYHSHGYVDYTAELNHDIMELNTTQNNIIGQCSEFKNLNVEQIKKYKNENHTDINHVLYCKSIFLDDLDWHNFYCQYFK